MKPHLSRAAAALLATAAITGSAAPAWAQSQSQVPMAPPAGATYADVADLADSAALVVHARIRKLARIEDVRARPPRPDAGRFYVEAQTQALITGRTPIGESFAYLVDLPLDAKGRPIARKKDEVILFARPVPGRDGELQLVRPSAQLPWSPAAEERVRAIVTALLAPDAPAVVTGVREVIHVPGNLAGEGETQIFLNTKDSSAASITVRHQPGQAPQWGVSFSELVAAAGAPPQRDTVEWFRLACALPQSVPPGTNLSEGLAAQQRAEADYRLVLASLGPCRRTL